MLVVYLFFIGLICIIVGHYEWQKKISNKPDVIYKFVDQWTEEDYARNQEDVFNKYNHLFQDQPINTGGHKGR